VQTGDYFVTVDIPAGAVLEKTTLTLSVKPVTKWGPFSRNMLTGISIQPSGVLFYEPVRISACSYSDYELTENDGIFLLQTNLLAIPCGDPEVSAEEVMAAAITYQSGNFAVASPSFEEVKQQASRLIEYAGLVGNSLPGTIPQQGHGPCPGGNLPEEDDCMGWQYTRKVVTGMMGYCERAIMAGKTYEEGLWRQHIEDFAKKAIKEFLNKPMPFEPCGLYFHAARKYREMEIGLGLGISGDDDSTPLKELMTSLLNKCLFRFTLETREWFNSKERRDDGGKLDESMNRHGKYSFNVPVFFTSLNGANDMPIRGEGYETVNYRKTFVLDDKERNETKSGERRVIDVKGGVSVGPDGKWEALVTIFLQNDIRSRAWGKGYGSQGSYDAASTDNSKTKEYYRFLLEDFSETFGDENGGRSRTVTVFAPPSGSDEPHECW
jgi:hypothetical protein